jgi:hypothetical protein
MSLSFAHRVPTVGAGQDSYNACLLSEDEMTSATCTYLRVRTRKVDRVVASYAVNSRMRDDRYAITSGGFYILWNLRQTIVNRLPGASMERLLEAHKQWVPTLDQPIVRMPRAMHEARVLKALQDLFDDLVRRKIYVPLTTEQYESIVRQADLPDAPAPPPETRLDRVLRKMASALMLLIVGFCILGPATGSLIVISLFGVLLIASLSLSMVMYFRRM